MLDVTRLNYTLTFARMCDKIYTSKERETTKMFAEMLMVLIDDKKTIRGHRIRPLSLVWMLLTFGKIFGAVLAAFLGLSIIYSFCFLI